jgi:hypothetical protein
LTNLPISRSGKISNTVSDGRQSLTPFGLTTIGRLIRIGGHGHQGNGDLAVVDGGRGE